MLPSGSNLLGSGDSWIKKFLPSGISIRPTIGVGGGKSGGYLPAGPQFPALPSGTPTGSGLGGIGAKLSVPLSALEKALAMFSSTAAKVGGGFGLGLYLATREVKGPGDDLDSLWDAWGNPTSAGREAGITWKQSEDSSERWEQLFAERDAAKAAAEAEKALAAARAEADKATAKETAAQEYWDALLSGDQQKINAATEKLFDLMGGYSDEWTEFQKKLDGWMSDDINWDPPEDLPKEWFSSAEETVTGVDTTLTAGMKTAGDNASIGMAIGIDRSAHYAMEAANRLAAAVAGCAQRTLAIQSPSKVMSRLGKFTSLGFAQGIESGAADVDRAVSHMLSATTRRPVTAMGGVPITGRTVAGSAAARAGSAAPDTVHVTLTMDDEVVGDIMAPIINAKIGAQIQATSRN